MLRWPDSDLRNVDKAQRYHQLRRRTELASVGADGLLLGWLLWSGHGLYLREVASFFGELTPGFEDGITAGMYGVMLVLATSAVGLPFAFYQGFVLEHRYELSNQRLAAWVWDYTKAVAIALVFGLVGASLVYATIRWDPDWWWVVAALGAIAVTVVLAQLAPVLLLPLFYSFKRLDRPALVERLLRLAGRAGTRVAGVYEWALSAQTKKANAALTGIGPTRRILLSDTLLAGYTDDEIEVVLAHELSHHVHHDVWRGLGLDAALIVVGFLAAHLALAGLADPLALRGVDDPAGLPLLALAGGASALLLKPVANAASRAHERRADRYALDLTRQPDAFISAMRRLGQQNLADDDPGPLVRWWFYSHPPIRERIAAARAWASAPPRAS